MEKAEKEFNIKNKENKCCEQKLVTNGADTNITTITLNVNSLNMPTKSQRLPKHTHKKNIKCILPI